jgi:hypothetical protein
MYGADVRIVVHPMIQAAGKDADKVRGADDDYATLNPGQQGQFDTQRIGGGVEGVIALG